MAASERMAKVWASRRERYGLRGGTRPYHKATADERFERYRVAGDPAQCWPWLGAKSSSGYGQFSDDDHRSISAHRYAYIRANGPIPSGMVVRHKCDNKPCCNPSHLEIGTALDNRRDADQRGRSRAAVGSKSGSAKLTETQVLEMRDAEGLYADIAAAYGVTANTVWRIKARRNWRHI